MSIKESVKEINGNSFVKKSYTVEEIVSLLGITRQSVYKLIDKGCFSALKLEKGYRVRKDSFDRWLDEKESEE